MGDLIRIKRGTRAQLDAAATAGQLVQGEPYYITDEDRIALGTSATTYQAYLKEGEQPLFCHYYDVASGTSGAVNVWTELPCANVVQKGDWTVSTPGASVTIPSGVHHIDAIAVFRAGTYSNSNGSQFRYIQINRNGTRIAAGGFGIDVGQRTLGCNMLHEPVNAGDVISVEYYCGQAQTFDTSPNYFTVRAVD